MTSCCCYHKGRNFQANHNCTAVQSGSRGRCCCYHKGRNFQANHNRSYGLLKLRRVVVATTKVGIFKQITTPMHPCRPYPQLLLLPQRQEFSSKSQLLHQSNGVYPSCCCYHKGRNFQANHNILQGLVRQLLVVVATTKVGIFKQITTGRACVLLLHLLLLLPQRQEFSSKSQPRTSLRTAITRCCCYHKGRNFQANHNRFIL